MTDRRSTDTRAILAIVVLLLSIGLLIGLSGCSGAGGVETLGSWEYRRITTEEGTEIHTVAGSIWGGAAHLVEETSIGTADGPDNQLIGNVAGVAAFEERIYVLDASVPVVRVYDWEGNHLQDIGREGDGPGEFRDPRSLIVHPRDGTVYVRGRGRIEIFTSAGEFIGRRQISGSFSTSRPMVLTDDGKIYSMQLLNSGAAIADWELAMVSYESEEASNDTIRAPSWEFEDWEVTATSEDGHSMSSTSVPYGPNTMWTMATNGSMVGGVTNDFRIEVRRPDSRRIVISRVWDPIPVPSAEATWRKKVITENFREGFPGWTWSGREVPSRKPAFTNLITDHSDRVWVAIHGRSTHLDGCAEDPQDPSEYYTNPCWTERGGWLLFSLDGQFLGEVEVPERTEIWDSSWIREETVITTASDEDGVPYVKRYRLVTP